MPEETREAGQNNSLDDYRTQWHMALMPAMKLELMDYSGILEYQSEHVLNTKALQIDLLVIKKDSNVVLKNEIGRMFRRYNIIEYKSPHDSEGVDEYIKTHAYASLYKINENGSVPYSLEDITITMIREGKPVRFFAWFDNRGCAMKEAYHGVYHIGLCPESLTTGTTYGSGR